MRKVLAISLVLIVCMAVPALASLDNWRVQVRATDSGGSYYGVYAQIGVYPGATDGADVTYDFEAAYAQGQLSQAWIASEIGTRTYSVDLHGQSATGEAYTLKAGVGSDYPDPDYGSGESTFKIGFYTMADMYQVVTGSPVPRYRLTLVDTKGVGGGPAWWADGHVWDLTIPTTANTAFLTLTDVPNRVVALNNPGMIDDGYEFKFEQIIPEPSSMLAFGTGLVGLVGFVVRRRRS
ncbi:MAG TPA: PEP-CTERM sorting domain-containing protein [Armatimonadota bacterium]|nr:PEP-CTERM sorting domain-containing protein [Armatimonadota bacterium]